MVYSRHWGLGRPTSSTNVRIYEYTNSPKSIPTSMRLGHVCAIHSAHCMWRMPRSSRQYINSQLLSWRPQCSTMPEASERGQDLLNLGRRRRSVIYHVLHNCQLQLYSFGPDRAETQHIFTFVGTDTPYQEPEDETLLDYERINEGIRRALTRPSLSCYWFLTVHRSDPGGRSPRATQRKVEIEV